jgi:hypothetical protein
MIITMNTTALKVRCTPSDVDYFITADYSFPFDSEKALIRLSNEILFINDVFLPPIFVGLGYRQRSRMKSVLDTIIVGPTLHIRYV